jgi:hypothetical protein
MPSRMRSQRIITLRQRPIWVAGYGTLRGREPAHIADADRCPPLPGTPRRTANVQPSPWCSDGADQGLEDITRRRSTMWRRVSPQCMTDTATIRRSAPPELLGKTR